VRFQVIKAVTVKIVVFCDVTRSGSIVYKTTRCNVSQIFLFCDIPVLSCAVRSVSIKKSLLRTGDCLKPTVYCVLSTTCCVLSTASCLLSAVFCLISFVYCLLPAAYCTLSHISLLSTLSCLFSTVPVAWQGRQSAGTFSVFNISIL
jgi:hypothetical protein